MTGIREEVFYNEYGNFEEEKVKCTYGLVRSS